MKRAAYCWLDALIVISLWSSLASAQGPLPTMIRVRLPATNELAAADMTVRERYLEDARAATTPEARRDLALTMSTAAEQSQDLAERYALRRNSALLAVRAGFWRNALAEADRLAAEFNLSRAATQAEIAIAIGDNRLAASKQGLDDSAISTLLIDVLEALLVEDKYEVAQKVWPYLNARDGFSRRAQEYAQVIAKLNADYVMEAVPALDKLKTSPLDATAHQQLADFYFTKKGDWEAALPHYALGTNQKIKTLAVRELRRPHEHDEHRALAMEYQRLANTSATGVERDWLMRRGSYWNAIAATSEPNFRLRAMGQTPSLPPMPEDVASFAPEFGHNMRRRGTPYGASLILTFDQQQPRNRQTVRFTLPSGYALRGERAVLFDLSPRRNHVEGLVQRDSSDSPAGMFENAWNMRAPLVCSERLLGQLSSFTWAGWLKLDVDTAFKPLFEEAPSAVKFPPQEAPPGLSLSASAQLGLEFTSPLAHRIQNSPTTPGFKVRPENNPLANRWVFVALTVDDAQQVHVTLNHRTITQSMGLLGPRNNQGLTLMGTPDGHLDNVVFYPRPLTQAEITTLYHRGLTRQKLAEYLSAGQSAPIPAVDFPPIVYKSGDSVASNTPPSTNPGNPTTGSPAPAIPATPKLAKPSDDEIKAARALIRELYAADFTKATTTEKRRELANKLKQVGNDSRDAPASRFACMFEAADLLSDAEVPEAYDAWDELARTFEVPVAREKGALLDRMQKKAKLPSDHKYLADRYVRLLNEAIEGDDYPLALSLATRAEACVKRAGDEVLDKTIDKGVRDLRQMMAAYEVAKPAKETLATSASDAAASAIWGRYLCLYRGQWNDGLALLARGSDALATHAKTDLAEPTDTKAQTDLAAEWWKAAESEKDERAQMQLRSRAVHWYQKVVGSATGIQAAQIKQRIGDHQAAISPLPTKKPFDALSMVDVSAHAPTGRWAKDRGAVAVIPDQTRGSELIIPVGLHGSYELSTRLEWQGRSGAFVLRLPVANETVQLSIGSGMGLENARGGNLNNVRLLHPATSLDAGRRYEVTAAVNINDDDVEINVALNSRPYLSWTGTVKDLDVSQYGVPVSGGFGAPLAEPLLRFHGRSIDPYIILTTQLNVTRGWASPVMRVGPAMGSSRTGF